MENNLKDQHYKNMGIKPQMETLTFQAETAKFVVGQRSLDELENFFTELADLGVDEYISICEEAYADYNGPEN